MNRSLQALELVWSGRTLRERRMLLVMAGLLFVTLVWLGAVQPVLAWRAEAADRAARSALILTEVKGALASLAPDSAPAPVDAEGVEPLIRRTAESSALEVVTTMGTTGQLGFQLSRVDSRRLFAWLGPLESDHRLTICSLSVVENADMTLNVEGTVSRGRCAA